MACHDTVATGAVVLMGRMLCCALCLCFSFDVLDFTFYVRCAVWCQVTVMREPLSHFRSSWRYWGVHEVAKVQPATHPGVTHAEHERDVRDVAGICE